jgi:hypothetical protein
MPNRGKKMVAAGANQEIASGEQEADADGEQEAVADGELDMVEIFKECHNSCKKALTDIAKEAIVSLISDEDMTPMHTTMIGAWNGVEEVQQRFPSQQGGPRLIWFESPRWRPKAIQVRVQFGVQEQCAIKRTPRSHTESVLDVLYMVRSRIS